MHRPAHAVADHHALIEEVRHLAVVVHGAIELKTHGPEQRLTVLLVERGILADDRPRRDTSSLKPGLSTRIYP